MLPHYYYSEFLVPIFLNRRLQITSFFINSIFLLFWKCVITHIREFAECFDEIHKYSISITIYIFTYLTNKVGECVLKFTWNKASQKVLWSPMSTDLLSLLGLPSCYAATRYAVWFVFGSGACTVWEFLSDTTVTGIISVMLLRDAWD